jgi:6-phosphogluconolactonase
MMNFRVFETEEAAVSGLTDLVVTSALQSGRCVISLSGGTTPAALYESLSRGSAWDELSRCQVVWVMGDERCVAPDHEMSNSRMVTEKLFGAGIPDRHTFLRFRTELGDPAEVASAFEGEWRSHGIGRIDLALLGVGDDGHTASLFPGSAILSEHDRIAREVWVERLGAWRVSLTIPMLRSARTRIVLALGGGKKEILTRLLEGFGCPVSEVMSGGADAWWFVDREAYPGDEA